MIPSSGKANTGIIIIHLVDKHTTDIGYVTTDISMGFKTKEFRTTEQYNKSVVYEVVYDKL
jgi:hypothetical protein